MFSITIFLVVAIYNCFRIPFTLSHFMLQSYILSFLTDIFYLYVFDFMNLIQDSLSYTIPVDTLVGGSGLNLYSFCHQECRNSTVTVLLDYHQLSWVV